MCVRKDSQPTFILPLHLSTIIHEQQMFCILIQNLANNSASYFSKQCNFLKRMTLSQFVKTKKLEKENYYFLIKPSNVFFFYVKGILSPVMKYFIISFRRSYFINLRTFTLLSSFSYVLESYFLPSFFSFFFLIFAKLESGFFKN